MLLTGLPNEVLLHIIEEMDELDMYRFIQTCSKFHSLGINRLYQVNVINWCKNLGCGYDAEDVLGLPDRPRAGSEIFMEFGIQISQLPHPHAIHWAITHDSLPTLSNAIAAGVDTNAAVFTWLAAGRESEHILEAVLQSQSPDSLLLQWNGEFALVICQIVCRLRKLEHFKVFVSYTLGSPHLKPNLVDRMLIIACYSTDIAFLETLIQAGAMKQPHQHGDEWRHCPLLVAGCCGLDMTQLLLDNGSDLHTGCGNDTAMTIALANLNIETTEFLVDKGFDLQSLIMRSHFFATISAAVDASSVETLEFLLEHGADPSEPDEDGNPPLFSAMMMNDTTIAIILVENGADIFQPDHGGRPLFLLAVSRCHYSIVECMLNHEADIHQEASCGCTVASLAAQKDDEQIINMVRDAGCALHAAVPKHSDCLFFNSWGW